MKNINIETSVCFISAFSALHRLKMQTASLQSFGDKYWCYDIVPLNTREI